MGAHEGMRRLRWWQMALGVGLGLGLSLAAAAPGAAQGPPTLDVVIGNNFGHLPMFVGVEKGLFRKHGVDVRLKVVSTGTDMKAIQHIRYDPRISKYSVRAFEDAQEDILKLTLTNAPGRLVIPDQFAESFLAEVQRAHPEYFSDLAPLPPDAR